MAASKGFSTMQTNIGNMVKDTSSAFATIVGVWINDAYQDAWRRAMWTDLVDEDFTFTAKADYTTGTGAVSATNGSTTVDVTGATFSTDGVVAGRYVKIGDSSTIFTIASVTDEDTFVLDSAFDGTSTTTGSYTIYGQHSYSWTNLGITDFGEELFVCNTTNAAILERYQIRDWFQRRALDFGDGGFESGTPCRYEILPQASSIRLDPPPDSADVFAMPYKKTVSDLSGTTAPSIGSISLYLEEYATGLAYAYYNQYQKATWWANRAENTLRKLIKQEYVKINQMYQRILGSYGVGKIGRLLGDKSYDSI